MSLPNLCLKPHEVGDLAPGEPLCAPAQLRGHVKDWLGGDDYLFRSVQLSPGYYEWFARRQHGADAPLLKIFSVPKPMPQQPTLQHLLHRIQIGDFERSFYFGADARLIYALGSGFQWLCINGVGESLWENDRDEIRFRWGLHRELRLSPLWKRQTSDARVETEIRQMLADSSSHCAFAWNWLQLDQTGKNAVTLQFERGAWPQFEKLLRAISWSDPNWNSAPLKAPVWEWSFDLFDFSDNLAHYGMRAAIYGWVHRDGAMDEFSERQLRLLELIFTHLGASYNPRMDVFARALPPNRRLDCEFGIAVSQPTQHENLEAQLQLRDFLRDKVSPDELRELLS